MKPFKHKNLKEIVKNFTPNWFTLNMGTGISFLIMHNTRINFPYENIILKSFWVMDIFFFLLFSILFLSRIIFFPETVKLMLKHPVQSMFLGAVPMGLVPILEGFTVFKVNLPGVHYLNVSLFLWWFDAFLAVTIGLGVVFLMFTIQKEHSLKNMTAVWLLPIVACEVTASAGGFLAPYFNIHTAKVLIFSSYVLWSFSVPLAFSVLVILFLRLVTHKLPDIAMATTSWLTLGPLGTGALSLLLLGHASDIKLHENFGEFLNLFGIITGILIWGYALWWWIMSWLITLKYFKEGLPFSMGWWAFTFPVGVFTASTYAIYNLTGYEIFKILGYVFTVQLLTFWFIVFFKTLPGIWSGYLFNAPCLSEESGLPKNMEECKKFKEKD